MEILKYGDNRLTEKCQPVSYISLAMYQIVQEMFDTMYNSNGIGLAAPQVGINERFFIIDIRDGRQFVFINPEIISGEQESILDEGCLSFPGVFTYVKRYQKIKVKAMDINGEKFELEVDGLLAQAIQHENDHLNGILLTDRTIEEAEFQIKLQSLK